jgi:hypothetical protein
MKPGTSIKRITKVDEERFLVVLEYDDGFRGSVDLSYLFGAPKGKPLVLEILRANLFSRCFVESGALAWPNGFEMCPDALRMRAVSKAKTAA